MTSTQPTPARELTESWLIFLMGLVQFINIVDFMMVMPLGPDFAKAINIPTAHIGYVGGIYTLAAAISGFAGAFFFDRFRRKTLLLFCLAGLILGTVAGAFAWDMASLMSARVIAGLFGGTVSALSIAMISDVVPPARRGAAIGKVMGAFSAASVLGVPFGLELSARLSWHAPFIFLSIAGVLVWALAFFKIPRSPVAPNRLPVSEQMKQIAHLLSSSTAWIALAFMALSMLAAFMIIPNISAHLQLNWGYPRDRLGLLYLAGGGISFFCMRFAGKMIDKTSATLIASFFTILLIASLFAGFIFYPNPIPVIVIFVAFMIAMSGRNVAGQTLSSEVPPPKNRAAYMALQTALVHLSGAFGAFAASFFLTEENGRLLGVDHIAVGSILISCIIPFLYWRVETILKKTRKN